MEPDEEFSVANFEKKLMAIKDTQDGIQSMSSYCLQNRSHHKKIVSSWLNVLKQVKVEQRLTLFYLANDVIQYSKRKNYEFVESWGTTLQRATTMVREEKVKQKILRIFQIWEQRAVYNEEFLADLNGLLSVNVKSQAPTSEVSVTVDSDEFQTSVLVSSIRSCIKLETETDKNFKGLSKNTICDVESINSLKDRRHVEDVEKEIEESLGKLQSYVRSLKAEIKARGIILTALDQAEAFYKVQRGEVKVVANAYKNFGNRIKNMKKKLDELVPTLPSPIPSPDINAPSPEPDNDFLLPDDPSIKFNLMGDDAFNNQSNGFLSYMDGNLPFDINDFGKHSPDSQGQAQPIQVINSHVTTKETNNFSINEFFKSILSESYPTPVPQPVPPVTTYSSQPTDYSSLYSGPPLNFTQTEIIPGIGASIPNFHRPLLPPPLPPQLNQSDDYNNSSWGDVNMSLWNNSQDSVEFIDDMETPHSPPHFEREGITSNTIEYVEVDPNLVTDVNDVDHRQLNAAIIPESAIKKDKERMLDVDHRNLISLTGSPGGKSIEEVPPPPMAPPILWSSLDMDFRSESNSSSGEVDFSKAPPAIVGSADKDKATKVLVPPPPPPSIPLEPPPPHNMEEFLKNAGQQNFDKYMGNVSTGQDTSIPPPVFGKPYPMNRTPLKMPGQQIKAKNGRGDNVESVDMEMSDDDNEEYVNQRREGPFIQMQQQSPQNSMQRSLFAGPPINMEMDGPQPWQNNNMNNRNMNRSNNDCWESPGPPNRNNYVAREFFNQDRQFSPQMSSNFRGRGGNNMNMNNMNMNMNNGGNSNRGGSPYFRPPRGGPRGGFRGNFRGGNKQRGGNW